MASMSFQPFSNRVAIPQYRALHMPSGCSGCHAWSFCRWLDAACLQHKRMTGSLDVCQRMRYMRIRRMMFIRTVNVVTIQGHVQN